MTSYQVVCCSFKLACGDCRVSRVESNLFRLALINLPQFIVSFCDQNNLLDTAISENRVNSRSKPPKWWRYRRKRNIRILTDNPWSFYTPTGRFFNVVLAAGRAKKKWYKWKTSLEKRRISKDFLFEIYICWLQLRCYDHKGRTFFRKERKTQKNRGKKRKSICSDDVLPLNHDQKVLLIASLKLAVWSVNRPSPWWTTHQLRRYPLFFRQRKMHHRNVGPAISYS